MHRDLCRACPAWLTEDGELRPGTKPLLDAAGSSPTREIAAERIADFRGTCEAEDALFAGGLDGIFPSRP